MRHLNRIFFGALIGILGGISFGVTIFPIVVERLLPGTPDAFFLLSANRAIPAALLWAPGGGLVGYLGGGRRGAAIMGLSGLVVGLIYGVLVAPAGFDPRFLALTVVVAALYSAGAGFLVGAAFPPRDWEEAQIAQARAAKAANSDAQPQAAPTDAESDINHSGS